MELGKEEEDHMELPPGFRFHPTDEELITHYLLKKFVDAGFTSRAIGDVDLNKCEPWDLPRRAKMGEKEWYFFCVRDRKYPTGLRTNRATESGYWKATGKDKEIYRGKSLVGMKKTLVFYRGRAPKGQKTDWVMHEFRLEGLRTAKHNEWVISKVFNKSSVGKKASSLLPPLMDAAHVTCFSNATVGQRGHGGDILAGYFCPPNSLSAAAAAANPAEFQQNFMSPFYYDSSFMGLMEDDGYGVMRGRCKIEREMLSVSQETGITTTDMNPEISSVVSNDPPTSAGPLQLDECLWNY